MIDEFDEQLARELILDHSRHPRHQRAIEHPDASAEGQNPLCGDELRLDLQIEDGGIVAPPQRCSVSPAALGDAVKINDIDEGNGCQVRNAWQVHGIANVSFSGQGCSISQAATSMLTEVVVGKTVEEAAALQREDVTDLIGIPLSPVRLKCALLGLGVLKVALHRHSDTPLPADWRGRRCVCSRTAATRSMPPSRPPRSCACASPCRPASAAISSRSSGRTAGPTASTPAAELPRRSIRTR